MSTTGDNRLARGLRAEAHAEGRIQGAQEALLLLLEGGEFELTDAHRVRISACTDTVTIKQWAVRAVQGVPLDEVFSD
ncbi:hypothetical protein AB0L06_26065 [Spirillospora sp. NPDC052269]